MKRKIETPVCSCCKYYSVCGDPERTEICNGKETVQSVIIDGREMSLVTEIHSIFDVFCGAMHGHTGEYFLIMKSYKTHLYYAITKDGYYKAKAMGRKLGESETANFGGENVRGMSELEERKWDIDQLRATVDIWGNIKM